METAQDFAQHVRETIPEIRKVVKATSHLAGHENNKHIEKYASQDGYPYRMPGIIAAAHIRILSLVSSELSLNLSDFDYIPSEEEYAGEDANDEAIEARQNAIKQFFNNPSAELEEFDALEDKHLALIEQTDHDIKIILEDISQAVATAKKAESTCKEAKKFPANLHDRDVLRRLYALNMAAALLKDATR